MSIAPAKGNQTSVNSEYVLDQTGERAETRLHDLSARHDERTIHYLEKRGIEEGRSCLEVGGGSITSWLCTSGGQGTRDDHGYRTAVS